MRRKTKYPGVKKVGERKYKIRIKRLDPRTGKQKEVVRVVEADDAERASVLRAGLLDETEMRADRAQVRTYARSWLASRVHRLRASTAARYAEALELHILPELGDLYVDAVKARDVELWIGKQSRRYAVETVNGRLRVLKKLMADACAEAAIVDVVARVAALPVEHTEGELHNTLTEPELADVVGWFKAERPRLHPLVLTLAQTGLRFGEASALKWDDLDRHAGVIRIRRSHWQGTVATSTKTRRARRVPLGSGLLTVLDEHRARLLRKQARGVEEGWVFPSRTGKLHYPSVLHKPLRAALKACGVSRRVNVQGLRRAAEDRLRRLGVEGALSEAVMGHGRRMRSRYSSVGDDEVAKLAEVVDLPPKVEGQVEGGR